MQFFVPHCYTSAVFLTYPTPAGSQNHTEREGNCLYHLTMSLAAPQLVKERVQVDTSQLPHIHTILRNKTTLGI